MILLLHRSPGFSSNTASHFSELWAISYCDLHPAVPCFRDFMHFYLPFFHRTLFPPQILAKYFSLFPIISGLFLSFAFVLYFSTPCK